MLEHIRKRMPKKGHGKAKTLDPLSIPVELQTALEALYGHYEKTYELWRQAGIKIPPCFIVVCNNTSTSKLVYDYISGFHRENEDGSTTLENGRLELFRNFDEHGNVLGRPRTLLIDSEQLESGDALDKNFRDIASDEIDRFRREIIERTGDRRQAENLTDQDLLREVMNTVGKEGQLGESVRCVVSVSMLTEGWDANNVTHVLGVRAFGTQLLCEQVIGRALRRQSYDLNEKNLFNLECLRHMLDIERLQTRVVPNVFNELADVFDCETVDHAKVDHEAKTVVLDIGAGEQVKSGNFAATHVLPLTLPFETFVERFEFVHRVDRATSNHRRLAILEIAALNHYDNSPDVDRKAPSSPARVTPPRRIQSLRPPAAPTPCAGCMGWRGSSPRTLAEWPGRSRSTGVVDAPRYSSAASSTGGGRGGTFRRFVSGKDSRATAADLVAWDSVPRRKAPSSPARLTPPPGIQSLRPPAAPTPCAGCMGGRGSSPRTLAEWPGRSGSAGFVDTPRYSSAASSAGGGRGGTFRRFVSGKDSRATAKHRGHGRTRVAV
ncbi:MAG: hypothetical protein R6U98_07245 [Pirellulaceae bacterium]